jgi:ATP-dependent DNA helicase DinG
MIAARELLSERAAQSLREAISQAGGCEVFAILRREQGQALFDEVQLLARGNEGAVPALVGRVRWGDLTLHNHPSGQLQPSQADLNLASIMGELGVGSVIVDNLVARAYVVVEPVAEPKTQQVPESEVAALFASSGALETALSNFELRPGQVTMASAVMGAINEGRHLVVEAGTGTGKSLAYLMPALRWAAINKKRVVVATRTIALQEQLIFKDIPLARKLMSEAPHASLIKGRSNYVCLRKMHEALNVQAELWDDGDSKVQKEIADLAAWVVETGSGDKSQLPFLPSQAAWERISSESDMCLGNRCPFFAQSPFFRSRREAARSGLLVVNQALLFSDLAVRLGSNNYQAAAVMPPYDVVILDEAHALEEVATGHFGQSFSSVGLRMAVSRLLNLRGSGGLLARIEHLCLGRGWQERLQELEEELLPAFRDARDLLFVALDRVTQDLHEALNPGREREVVLWLDQRLLGTPGLEAARTGSADIFAELLRMVSCLKGVLAKLKAWDAGNDPPLLEGMIIELEARGQRLEQQQAAIRQFALPLPEDLIPWVDLSHSRHQRPEFAYTISPLSVAAMLQKALFEPFHSVVMTSATLDLKDDFAFFRTRTGLDSIKRSLSSLSVPSPFDFQSQARMAIAQPWFGDLPESRLTGRLAELIADLHPRMAGGTLVLFTSYGMLNGVASALEPMLHAQGAPLLVQGKMHRSHLIQRLKETHGVLLGTDSFWEGIDLPGTSLTKLVICKLPFPQMGEPVFQARSHQLDRSGKSSFLHLSLPLAMLKFKQGVGRLIRSRADRGIILVTDGRLQEKAYGRKFLQVIPPIKIEDFWSLWNSL